MSAVDDAARKLDRSTQALDDLSALRTLIINTLANGNPADVRPNALEFADCITKGRITPAQVDRCIQDITETIRGKPYDPSEWKPKPVSAAELLRMDFPAIRWTIDDILPEGLFLLAARPKIGKSWLALQTALGVASGGNVLNRRTAKGEALYLALGDNQRRLQQRLFKYRAGFLADQSALTRVQFETQWRRADERGIDDIHAWLDTHPDARLICIDTLEKFRARRRDRGNLYAKDYGALQGIKGVCDARQITVLIVHHTRKAASDDPVDSISGTLGFVRVEDDAKRYAFIESVLRRLGYRRRSLGVFPRARVRKFPTAFFRATGNNRTDVCLSSDRICSG